MAARTWGVRPENAQISCLRAAPIILAEKHLNIDALAPDVAHHPDRTNQTMCATGRQVWPPGPAEE